MPLGFLEVEHGPYQGIIVVVPDSGTVTVGRGEDCTLTIDDANSSRHHFSVSTDKGGVILTDLGTSNGTFLNGVRIDEPRPLSHGDAVRAGTTVFTFRELARSNHSGKYTGKSVGRYRVGVCIGSGGMGEVYKAVQQGLGRVVALKILTSDLKDDREYVSRFLHEARAAGQLNHPNVVQVFDVGQEGDIYYYSMEFVDGGSVQDLISGSGPLAQRKAAEIILEAARALDFAEKKNIIHCDVKPDNLMLTLDNHVKLADLGIAKRLIKGHKTKGDKDGVLGSPYYMSPEQAMGKPLDHRTDIYSLGATFYRLLTGRPPFEGDNSREIMEKQVYEQPLPLTSLVKPVHPELLRIVARMMAKSVSRRYQNASRLVADLERVMPRLPEDQVPQQLEPPEPVISAETRRSMSVVIGVLLAVALALAVILYFARTRLASSGDPHEPPPPAQETASP
ncbi:MAG: protein kinase [Planctomycetes bacterium]|nr:protein kinase [Planctomycetota bacterium]